MSRGDDRAARLEHAAGICLAATLFVVPLVYRPMRGDLLADLTVPKTRCLLTGALVMGLLCWWRLRGSSAVAGLSRRWLVLLVCGAASLAASAVASDDWMISVASLRNIAALALVFVAASLLSRSRLLLAAAIVATGAVVALEVVLGERGWLPPGCVAVQGIGFMSPAATLGHRNSAALVLLPGICFVLTAAAWTRRPLGCAGVALTVALFLDGLIATRARVSFGAALVGVGAVVWAHRRDRAALARLAAVAAVAVVLVALVRAPAQPSSPAAHDALGEKMARLVTAPTTDRSAFERLALWRFSVEMTGRHPLVGVGAGRFYEVWGREQPEMRAAGLNAHSVWLNFAAESGLPALLLSLVGGAWLLLAARRRLVASRDATVVGYAVVVCALSFAGLFEAVQCAPGSSALFAASAGVLVRADDEATAEVAVEERAT